MADIQNHYFVVEPDYNNCVVLKTSPDSIYKQEFEDSCEKVKKDRDEFYLQLCAIEGMTVFKPDANYIYCRLPDKAVNGPEVTKRLFIEHNIYIKDSVGKTQPDGERYIRIASRTPKENDTLVTALKSVMY